MKEIEKVEAELKKIKKPSWIDEFKTFALKGNVMDLAVGVIIGAAFQGIIKSLTDDVIMPVVSIFLGGIDFSEMKLTLPRLFGKTLDDAGNVVVNTLNYGKFLTADNNNLINALVVIWMVKLVNGLMDRTHKKEAPAPAPAPEPSAEEKLLTEIRDLLKDDKK